MQITELFNVDEIKEAIGQSMGNTMKALSLLYSWMLNDPLNKFFDNYARISFLVK